MAYSNIPLIASGILYTDTDLVGTAVAVKASIAVVYELELDNTANAAASYFKAFNTGTVVVGTTVPDIVIMVPALTKITLVLPSGVTFGTALTVCATTAGGTAGSTGPTSDFAVKIVYV
jgi:hypothetical protein